MASLNFNLEAGSKVAVTEETYSRTLCCSASFNSNTSDSTEGLFRVNVLLLFEIVDVALVLFMLLWR